jgi:hypothetical protein
MPRIAYTPRTFKPAQLDTIQKVNQIIATYSAQGYSLTLRQVYYQFVARDWLQNTFRNYKNLGNLITDARRAGEIDWRAITDRTRNVKGSYAGHEDPSETINPYYFGVAMWEGQANRAEVWVEKDALVDVIGRAAGRYGVPYFSCRGYTSDSEVWVAARRLEEYLSETTGDVTILHLGDHDPSGIDMTRDIQDRLELFIGGDLGYSALNRLEIRRIALNMDQVEQYGPPPNPAKITDSRAKGYMEIHGDESWELDALEPSVLDELIQSNIRPLIDPDPWAEQAEKQRRGRATLQAVKDNYDKVIAYLDGEGLMPSYSDSSDFDDDEEDLSD